MANTKLPNIPDVTGETIKQDHQLRNLLIAIKITLEKITNQTTEADLLEIILKD